MKRVRHAIILEVIKNNDVHTQDELALELKRQGLAVTQATVSRDIKDLRLIKVPADSGGYCYAAPDKGEPGMVERLIRIFAESVVSIVSAGNLIIIKTLPGSAAIAAEVVDTLAWSEVVGTLAGDNTIFVAVSDAHLTTGVKARFEKIIKTREE